MIKKKERLKIVHNSFCRKKQFRKQLIVAFMNRSIIIFVM